MKSTLHSKCRYINICGSKTRSPRRKSKSIPGLIQSFSQVKFFLLTHPSYFYFTLKVKALNRCVAKKNKKEIIAVHWDACFFRLHSSVLYLFIRLITLVYILPELPLETCYLKPIVKISKILLYTSVNLSFPFLTSSKSNAKSNQPNKSQKLFKSIYCYVYEWI